MTGGEYPPHLSDLSPEVHALPDVVEVPRYDDVLPDGRAARISGDPVPLAEFNHQQGDNPFDVRGDCGLVSCQDILNQFGVDVSETDVVAFAMDHGWCDVSSRRPEDRGGTTPGDWVRILDAHGVPAHVETGVWMSDLAATIESGQPAVLGVNAATLWDEAPQFGDVYPDHAVVATAVARDRTSGEILGFFINDSGDGQGAKFVSASVMGAAWEDMGGMCLIVDRQSPAMLGH